jgi:hypothetical protein
MRKNGLEYKTADVRWAILWQSSTNLMGIDAISCGTSQTNIMIFHTRHEARKEIWIRFGYIKDRPDLKSEPHGWKMPKPVRIKLTVELEH